MKKLSIFLVVVLLVSSISMAAFAQDDGAGASNGEEQTELAPLILDKL